MAWRTFLEFYKCFAPRKVYLVVAGGLLITSLIASIFMFGLRDTVSIMNGVLFDITSKCSPRRCIYLNWSGQVRANPNSWFLAAMLMNIPILGIILAMACCNEKVEKICNKRSKFNY